MTAATTGSDFSLEIAEDTALLLPGAVQSPTTSAADAPSVENNSSASATLSSSSATTAPTKLSGETPRPRTGCGNPLVALVRCCPLPVRKAVIHCAFWPTLGILRLRTCCCGSRIRWYDRIDLPDEPAEGGALFQGAFPLSFVLRRLATRENVRVVVSNTAEHDGRQQLMEELHIAYHRPCGGTVDFAVPTVDALEEGAAVLHEAISTRGEACYVHCKAGKGRATCMVIAYLTKYRHMSPLDAQAAVSEARPQASYVIERPGMRAFFSKNAIDWNVLP